MTPKLENFYRKPVEFTDKQLTFQCIEWLEFNENTGENGSDDSDEGSMEIDLRTIHNKEDETFILRIFGVTEKGYSVCLDVNNFTPFFYIKVPDSWKKSNMTIFLSKLSEKLKKCMRKEGELWITEDYSKNLLIKKCILQLKYDFFGFTNKREYKFLRLTFNNSAAMKKAITILKKHNSGKSKLTGFTKMPLYEANIDATLKFAHIKNLKFAGWLKTDKFTVIPNEFSTSTCQIHCSADWNTIELNDINNNAPILQASYDIETYSVDGSFPSPTVKGNVITQIATTYKIFGQKDFYFKHIICLKNCSPIRPADNTPVFLECYNTEYEVLTAWNRLIINTDPDILYQYNGDQFDGRYLATRAEMTDCDQFFTIGKLKHIKGKITESYFKSSAYGDNHYYRLSMPGRLNFDILTYIKREYKEDSYKLDHIAEKYVGQNKNPITAKMMFEAFREGNADKIRDVAEYCLVDTLLPQKLVDKMHILQSQISMSNVTYVPIRYLYERGQLIKVMSQVLKETRKQGYLVPTQDRNDSKEEGEENEEESFVGATVLPPLKGAYFEPITVCDFASLYPSIIRAHNLCYSTIITDNSFDNLPEAEYSTIEWEDTINDKTEKKKYRYAQSIEGVLPKILSELTVARKDYKKMMESTDDPFLKEVFNKCQLAVKVSMNSVYGFLAGPMLCCKPIAATVTAIGRMMIEDTKKFMEKNYQAALTVYGDTDSVFIKFKTKTSEEYRKALDIYEKTQEGKEALDKLKTKCIQESIDLGVIAAKNATSNLFKFPIKLEYEKVYCPLLLLSKKRYIGILYSNKADKPDKMDSKGIVLKRRDNFPLLKKTYSKIIDILLEQGAFGKQSSREYLEDVLYKIVHNGFTDLSDFVISKTLNRTYKNQNVPQLALARKLAARDPNSAPQSNDRVPFVFISPYAMDEETKEAIQLKNQKEYIEKVAKKANQKVNSYEEAIAVNKNLKLKVVKKRQGKYINSDKVEDPEYAAKNNLPVDAEYYISFMRTPLKEILSLFMDNPDEIFDTVLEEYHQSHW